jgi:ribonuclease VapC
MIVDSSAIVAILKNEPEKVPFTAAIAGTRNVRISAATLFETMIVIDGMRDPVKSSRVEEFLGGARMEIVDMTAVQARLARAAYRDFGKGSGHPARLNFGDCFSYALAKVTGEPLLFKGDDFGHTDLTSAVRA